MYIRGNEIVLEEKEHKYLGDSHALSAEEARKQVCQARFIAFALVFSSQILLRMFSKEVEFWSAGRSYV